MVHQDIIGIRVAYLDDDSDVRTKFEIVAMKLSDGTAPDTDMILLEGPSGRRFWEYTEEVAPV